MSKLLSVAAWRINPSEDARYAMLAAAASPGIAGLTGHTDRVHAVAFSPARQDPGQRKLRRHGAAVGRGHPPADRQAADGPRTARSTRWRSARTARPWPPAATMARCGCGMWPPTARSRSPLTGHARRRSIRWRSARTARPWPPAASDGTVRLWDVATHQPDRQPSDRPRRYGLLGGVQPGRQDPGQRRRRWHRAAVERGHRTADRGSRLTTEAGSGRWRSARTARPWPPAAADGSGAAVGPRHPAPDREILAHRQPGFQSVAFSPDGKILASRRAE